MSTSRGSVAGNGGGVQPIPAGSKKIVLSLKEIVNCSEAEIYATLKECNMDPNEAVNRLLTQDPFREVKSKREKKKEGKDTTEPRSRGTNNSSRGGGKTGADRYVNRGGSTPYNISESAPSYGKSSYKKENGSTPYSSSLSSVPDVSGNSRSRGHSGLSYSDVTHAENKGSTFGAADVMPSTMQPTSGYQSTWVGAPGQVSMADIVKMGRPQNKTAHAPNASHDSRFHENYESGLSSVQQSTIDEWPSIEKPAPVKAVSIPEYAIDSEQHPEASGLPPESGDQLSDEEEVQETEDDDDIENPEANDVGSVPIASRKIPEDASGGDSLFENDLYKNMGSYQPQAHDFEHHEVEEVAASVSSVSRNLQQLSVDEDDGESPSEEYPSVVIPDHLQVQNVDCSHLSFGSFGSAMGNAYSSGTVTSVPGKTNFEEPHIEADISLAGHQETRSSEYYVDDSLRNVSDGGLFHRTGANAGSYDPSPALQPEELKPETAEMPRGDQYPFPSSNPAYNYDDAQQLNAAFNQTSSHMQNLSTFPNVMQYPNSLPSTLSAANAHPSREADLQYSPFPVAQSMSNKYGNTASSIGGSALSMSEALKTAGFSSSLPASEALSGTSVATGPPLPQHLSVHPYSQHTLPLGPFANMIGYPFLPQSYAYMPSAFQQAFAGNNSYHQSLAAAMLPQYKNSVSASSLPQSAAIPSGYGAFGNTTSIPGNFPMNSPAAPSGTSLNYDDVLSSQYKDSSHLVSLQQQQQQQNENAAMWLHGANSRTMSAVPASQYYNYQGGQNQQQGGFRQGQQQPSQSYGGYNPNFYHSQTLDQQQQNPRDVSLGSSQVQPKQSQFWQNGY